jgi:alpha,alpha-trehalase
VAPGAPLTHDLFELVSPSGDALTAVTQLSSNGTLESNFPPISDYALLSDCENTCLIAPTGAVEWLCLPRPHDPSVFGTLLDRSAGAFRFGPMDVAVPSNRRYVPGTMVLATTWQTRTGWLAIRDFLAVGPWRHTVDRSTLHRRVPGDFDSRHALVRIATCLDGAVDVGLSCEPSFEYGRLDASWLYEGPGYYRAATSNPEHLKLTLTGDLRLGLEGRAVKARHRLLKGESCHVVLSWADQAPIEDIGEARSALADTDRFWRGWLDGGHFPDHPWRETLQRSALTLKSLTYASTGALLAAPTTSLPEYPGGNRNWDYRYAWIRDGSFTLWALHALGFDSEADDFIGFLADALEDDPGTPEADVDRILRVLYAVDGQDPPEEVELGHLSGYAGSRPVRVGNAASDQEQFDILGAIVDCVYQHAKTRDALSERAWGVVVQAVEVALRRWRDPDQSIWEMRGDARHYTYTKVMCWVAADRGARLASLRGEAALSARWRIAANEIHDDVCTNGVNADGQFTQSYGSDNLDASLLLLPLLRFLPPEDERLRSTVLAIADDLTESGLVRRYRVDVTDDGLEEPESSFTLCSFWLVSALDEIGETDRARKLCERLIKAASNLGLYGEELDPTTGRHLGNFPQALTHLALVNAVLHVIANETVKTRGSCSAASYGWWAAAG